MATGKNIQTNLLGRRVRIDGGDRTIPDNILDKRREQTQWHRDNASTYQGCYGEIVIVKSSRDKRGDDETIIGVKLTAPIPPGKIVEFQTRDLSIV